MHGFDPLYFTYAYFSDGETEVWGSIMAWIRLYSIARLKMKSPGQSPNVHGNRTHIYINLYGGLGGVWREAAGGSLRGNGNRCSCPYPHPWFSGLFNLTDKITLIVIASEGPLYADHCLVASKIILHYSICHCFPEMYSIVNKFPMTL